jgi:hypothetical protein
VITADRKGTTVERKPVSPAAKAPAANSTGDVYVNPIQRGEDPSRLIVSLVRFTPNARTNWHSHAVGQILHVTDGVGFVTRDNFMCHLAMLEGVDGGDGARTRRRRAIPRGTHH